MPKFKLKYRMKDKMLYKTYKAKNIEEAFDKLTSYLLNKKESK